MPPAIWADGDKTKLEDGLADIVVSVLLFGDAGYRNSRASMHKWEIDRREAQTAERLQARKDAERRERERVVREGRRVGNCWPHRPHPGGRPRTSAPSSPRCSDGTTGLIETVSSGG